MSVLPEAWDRLLDRPLERMPHRQTLAAARALAAQKTVYPPEEDWFAALRLTFPEAVRVVILGQDPYHAAGQAVGLAFSVRQGVKLPPSLRNIFKELEADLGQSAPSSGDLTPWAKQGVLLLNTVLTVEEGLANSHRDLGWQAFTDAVIAALAGLPQPIAFLLWGAQAQEAYRKAADRPISVPAGTEAGCAPGPRLILESAHPSPLSAYRGFFGSRPFSRVNRFLRENGAAEIRWAGD